MKVRREISESEERNGKLQWNWIGDEVEKMEQPCNFIGNSMSHAKLEKIARVGWPDNFGRSADDELPAQSHKLVVFDGLKFETFIF